jgi:DNA invertase Pin-like site-specific DNA recombinase
MQIGYVGYARVSIQDQTPALQQGALTAAGCHCIFTDTPSGALAERPGLTEALGYVRPGDTLVVWRLGRLGRSRKHPIEVVTMLEQRVMGFKSLTESIDTTTSGGKLIFHVLGALAEFECDLIRERTKAGLTAARARPHRRPVAMAFRDPAKLAVARKLYAEKQTPVGTICSMFKVSRASFNRYGGGGGEPDATADAS